MNWKVIHLAVLALPSLADASPKVEAGKLIDKFGKINQAQCLKSGVTPAISVVQEEIPTEQAQCTPGAKDQKHSGVVRIITYPKNVKIAIEPAKTMISSALGADQSGSVPDALPKVLEAYPSASYVSNACMFEAGGNPSGYLRVKDKVISKIDFKDHTGQNFGKENSVLIRYRPGKYKKDGAGNYLLSPDGKRQIESTSSEYKWRLVPRDWFGRQLQISDYRIQKFGDLQRADAALKRGDPDAVKDESDDLLSSEQINFAIQSGPALIRGGDAELLSASRSSDQKVYNMPDSGHKTLSGIDEDGNFVVVDVDGNVGPYCLAKYLSAGSGARKGIRDLLTRDAYRIGGSVYRDENGGTHVFNQSSDTSQIMVVY